MGGNYSNSSEKDHLTLYLIIQRFLLYQLRFVSEADLCKARSSFGGLGAQIPHLSIAISLAVVETVGVSSTYHNALSLGMAEKDRHRPTDAAEFAQLLSAEQLGGREQAKRDVSNLKPTPVKTTPC